MSISSKYQEQKSILGTRIMDFRKSNHLTQADLADRYEISGPAVFKFEKGFVTPSLKLWQKMAKDMDIPEKEAVLIWVKEKLPARMHKMIRERSVLDMEEMKKQLEEASKEQDSSAAMRSIILGNPDITPSFQEFVSEKTVWEIMKPTLEEVVFLIEIDQWMPRLTVDQFRDLLIVARAIRKPED
ncbi:MAG: helix-turn-helix domain-containing protein [Candidatus Sumerlaeia bacterium]